MAGLADAAREALAVYARVDAAREGFANQEGGDVAASGSDRSLLRHVANYLAAARLAADGVGHVVDIGSGVGALAVWLAERLEARLSLVDADPAIRAVAGRAFPEASVHADPAELPAGSAELVTGMEVIEHVTPDEHAGLVAAGARLVAAGGLLVLSTPDETRYLGGWSGYAPHVGVLDADSLHTVVAETTGWPTRVWRLEGEPFALDGASRVLEPVGNRVVGLAAARAPGVLRRLERAAGALAARRAGDFDDRARRLAGSARAVPPHHGTGSGLLAVACRPA